MEEKQLVEKIAKGEIRLYEVEKYTDGDTDKATEARRKAIEKITGVELKHIPHYSLDTKQAMKRHIENMIGVCQLPLGIAGPIRINGDNAKGDYYIPLATTEGALVASVNRGCSLITKAGGCRALVYDNKTTRAPVFRCENIDKAVELVNWVNKNKEKIMQKACEDEPFMKMIDIKPYMVGRTVFLRFMANTGDAMGMNMITIGSEKACKWIAEQQKVAFVATTGNMCSDKKPCAINLVEGRGKSVVAEVLLPKEMLEKVMKCDADDFVDVNYRKNLLGSAKAGAYGFNAHFANMVAAFFIATGQDEAHTVEGSHGFTTAEKNKDGSVTVSVTLPCLNVASVGGGTACQTQSEALKILGVYGGGDPPGSNAIKVAEICASVVLAGELSLLGALAAGHLSQAHARLGR